MRRSLPVLSRAAAIGAMLAGLEAGAGAEPLQIGVLDCNVAPGPGFILGSAKDISCAFHPFNGRPEYYAGRITRYGVDIGVTGPARFSWAVFADALAAHRYALAGYYAGTGGSVSLVAGPSADALIGGVDNAISLAPLMSTSTGINLSIGIGSLMLQPSPIPPRPIPFPW